MDIEILEVLLAVILVTPLAVLFWKLPLILTTWNNRPLRKTPKQKLSKLEKKRLKKEPTEINYLRVLIQQLMMENRYLQNLVISKDPQTFAAIQAVQPMNTVTSSDYIPSGTDIDEYNKWAVANGQQPVDLSEFLVDSDGTGGLGI